MASLIVFLPSIRVVSFHVGLIDRQRPHSHYVRLLKAPEFCERELHELKFPDHQPPKHWGKLQTAYTPRHPKSDATQVTQNRLRWSLAFSSNGWMTFSCRLRCIPRKPLVFERAKYIGTSQPFGCCSWLGENHWQFFPPPSLWNVAFILETIGLMGSSHSEFTPLRNDSTNNSPWQKCHGCRFSEVATFGSLIISFFPVRAAGMAWSLEKPRISMDGFFHRWMVIHAEFIGKNAGKRSPFFKGDFFPLYKVFLRGWLL